MTKASRAATATLLAPIAPPCFEDRLSWVEYLSSAAEHQRLEHVAGPLLFVKGAAVRFDPSFSYCADCQMAYRSRMLQRDRCDPDYVRRQLDRRARVRQPLLTGVVVALSVRLLKIAA